MFWMFWDENSEDVTHVIANRSLPAPREGQLLLALPPLSGMERHMPHGPNLRSGASGDYASCRKTMANRQDFLNDNDH